MRKSCSNRPSCFRMATTTGNNPTWPSPSSSGSLTSTTTSTNTKSPSTKVSSTWMMFWKPRRNKCYRLFIRPRMSRLCSMSKRGWLFSPFVWMFLRSGYRLVLAFWPIIEINTLMSVLQPWLQFSLRDYNSWSIRVNCLIKLKSKLPVTVTGINSLWARTNIWEITITLFYCKRKPKSHSPKRAKMSPSNITPWPPTWLSATDQP